MHAVAETHEIPLNAQLLIYAEHITAEGVATASEQALALQRGPLAHPQEFPAPSVAALQRAKFPKDNKLQGAALAHIEPLKAHVLR